MLSIELTDFPVQSNQGAAEAAITATKGGKAEVMCEQGHPYKVTKSKEGKVEKIHLTKHRTDWVDFWPIDFDYLQRKEIIKVAAGMAGSPPCPASNRRRANFRRSRNAGRGYIFESEWQSFRTRQNRDWI